MGMVGGPRAREGGFCIFIPRTPMLYLYSKTTHMKSYEMYSAAGDKACETLVNQICKKIRSNVRVTREEIVREIEKGQMLIGLIYPEVHDTEPRGHICHEVSKALKDSDYSFFIDSYINLCEGVYPYYS
jgi:predicted  nucleic acid-binding Zn ribbon protein